MAHYNKALSEKDGDREHDVYTKHNEEMNSSPGVDTTWNVTFDFYIACKCIRLRR